MNHKRTTRFWVLRSIYDERNFFSRLDGPRPVTSGFWEADRFNSYMDAKAHLDKMQKLCPFGARFVVVELEQTVLIREKKYS